MTQLNFRPLAFALSAFLALTYIFCVIYGLFFHEYAMHKVWEVLLPGFYWLTWGTFFLGLVETILYGFYTALVFVPLYNYFSRKYPTA